MVGGGIATMSAAVFLIRDAVIPGSDIHFLAQLHVVGGSMDGARSRFLQEFGRIDTPAGVRRSNLDQYDSVIRPVEVWLEAKGVDIRYGTRAEDIDFTGDKSARRVSTLQIRDDGGPSKHFRDQLPETYTLWGCALYDNTAGDYVTKSIQDATGTEILQELLGHLGFDDQINDITRETTTVTRVQMPYIDSPFQRRQDRDRPAVILVGAENFAFVGQFVEIPDDTIFTVEYSVHGGMITAYRLAGVTDKKIPPLYNAMLHPDAALKATRVLFTDRAKDEDPSDYAGHQRDWRITHA